MLKENQFLAYQSTTYTEGIRSLKKRKVWHGFLCLSLLVALHMAECLGTGICVPVPVG